VPEERRRRASRRERAASLEPKRTVATVRCPFCHDDVPQDALAAKCGKCQTVHHATCFDEKGGCSVDGCGGKAAHVVKGWRAALGECRACKAKVYLDENVAVCASCESYHHPSCLEARDGCAECGSGEGMIALASAVKDAQASPWTFAVIVPIALGVFAAILLASIGETRFIGLPICIGGGLTPLAVLLSRRAARRRALALGERVTQVKPEAPPSKPEG
jgi:hypothetical protein